MHANTIEKIEIYKIEKSSQTKPWQSKQTDKQTPQIVKAAEQKIHMEINYNS